MKTVFLGNTGLRVSELCLGTMTMGASTWGMQTESEDAKCFEVINAFVKAGGNFLDTADAYGSGASEEVVGRWLKTQANRDDFVIATKVFNRMGTGPNDVGLSRKHILQSVDASLKRLQTDYIDLYQVHSWDGAADLRETLTTLNDLVRIGKVRYIGCSNFAGWQLQKFLDLSKHLGLEPFVSLQPQYSLLCRSTEWELFPVCRFEGLGVLPWSPLKGGWLAGKYEKGKPPCEGRVAWSQAVGWQETNWDNMNNEHTWKVIDEVKNIAAELGTTPSAVALRWVIQRPGVTSTIIGARTIEQLNENLEAAKISLNEDQMARLNKVSEIELPYPYGVIRFTNERNERKR